MAMEKERRRREDRIGAERGSGEDRAGQARILTFRIDVAGVEDVLRVLKEFLWPPELLSTVYLIPSVLSSPHTLGRR
eukprot:747112-Hanusia_phi.AAC.1